MARFKIHFISITLFIIALISAGRFPAHSDSPKESKPASPIYDASYRSPASAHKVIVQSNERELRDSILQAGGSIIEDYGAFALMSAPSEAANQVSIQSAVGSSVRDDMNLILLRAHTFDTTLAGSEVTAASVGEAEPADQQLYLVQMIGPVKKEWVNRLESEAEIVSYIPNNAYLIRASAAAVATINNLKSSGGSFIQWAGAFKPDYKIAPELSFDSDEEITVTVQLANGENAAREIEEMAAASSASVIDESPSIPNCTNAHVRVRPSKLPEIARKSNVVWIEPWAAPELHDERQNLIVSGQYTGNQLNSPGYLSWLTTKGLATTPDFIVDIADTGIDQGNLDPQVIHKDFLNTAGSARIAYARYVGLPGVEGTSNDTLGHGTINAAIAGGYNVSSGFPYKDDGGYSLGLGVHPFMKIGVSRIFAPEYTNPPLVTLVDMMYRDGARISSNSWGAYNNSYNTDSQLYDSLVRDARRGEAGNQELAIIFSSGNKGAGGNLTVPGNAKNTIMVGASESLRPGLDGCQVNSEGADDINSLINFSSGGPTLDGRIKPDITAPGTHIQGARSQDRAFTAGGVCGPGNFPTGQTLYTWSSGTSHAAPAVSGAAALVRQYFQQSVGHPASPAMIKAFLTNSATYMTGFRANDNLPGNNQGWGLLNIGRALDNAPRILVDQDRVLGGTGQAITITGKVADPTKPFRVTLAWTDAPGTPTANPVVNDLDLQVVIGGKTYLGNRFSGSVSVEGGTADHLNNVEGVWAPTGASGDFTIRIVATNLAGDGVPGNSDSTDQDFALVVYNATSQSGGGGGGGGTIDSPPTVNLTFPKGGEKLTVGNIVRILWDASDDKGIQSQRIDFAADGTTFNTIGAVGGQARNFDWRIPSIPTPLGKIRITALDGVNLPVSSINSTPFEIAAGPPDNTPPQVLLVSPNTKTTVGGGQILNINWKETDNVGVIQRVIELSTNNGSTFQQIISLTAPSSGQNQNYDWLIPITLASDNAKVRLTIYDGAGNAASVTSSGKFDIWPLPIITQVDYNEGDKDELELTGRNFRKGETEIYVDGKLLKKVFYESKFLQSDGTYIKVKSKDKKINKRVPLRVDVMVEVKLPLTGQVSPGFAFKRKRPN
ncbi:MAG TPA: S8 family serine peptidase [Blastocatellia bacterium]|nr:S8 family serine peptidase [Blastocatellia bacterium]